MIKKTYKNQYEYNGELYDSLQDLKKGESKKINNMLADFVKETYSTTKEPDDYTSFMYYQYADRLELAAKMAIISDYEKIRHVFFEIEQEREKLANDLRLFAWKESFFPNSFIWTGYDDLVEE